MNYVSFRGSSQRLQRLVAGPLDIGIMLDRMENAEHLAKLKEGVKTWNDWRRGNPYFAPDLCGADLSGANLMEADLRGANFREARLVRANLIASDLSGAKLRGADLSYARLGD